MPNPFIDPLDTTPVQRKNVGETAKERSTSAGANFKSILEKKVQEEPTPILTPAALKQPDLPISSKILAPSVIQYEQENPKFQSSDKHPPLAETNLSPVKRETDSLEENQKPQSKTSVNTTEPASNLYKILTETSQKENQEKIEASKFEPEPINETENRPIAFEQAYTVKRGDTLSEIVASAMRSEGMKFDTVDIYSMVRKVAQANGISNSNFITVGQQIDLSSIATTGPTKLQPTVSTAFSTSVQPESSYQAPLQGRITSEFGMRRHPITGIDDFHNGLDVAVPIGTPVQPIQAGIVTFSGIMRGYGQLIEIEHEDGTQSRYGHLSSLLVSEGDSVQTDQVTALSGETGLTTGPHLHLEILKEGQPQDPLNFIPRDSFEMGAESESNEIVRARHSRETV